MKAELGLEETDEITDEFLDLMKQDRCGFSEAKKTSDYSAILKWVNYKDITYCFDFDNMYPRMSVSTQINIFEDALRDWQRHARFYIRFSFVVIFLLILFKELNLMPFKKQFMIAGKYRSLNHGLDFINSNGRAE